MGPKITSERKRRQKLKNLIEAAAANGPRIEKCSNLTWSQIFDFSFENEFIKKVIGVFEYFALIYLNFSPTAFNLGQNLKLYS